MVLIKKFFWIFSFQTMDPLSSMDLLETGFGILTPLPLHYHQIPPIRRLLIWYWAPRICYQMTRYYGHIGRLETLFLLIGNLLLRWNHESLFGHVTQFWMSLTGCFESHWRTAVDLSYQKYQHWWKAFYIFICISYIFLCFRYQVVHELSSFFSFLFSLFFFPSVWVRTLHVSFIHTYKTT